MISQTFTVLGMTCQHCVNAVNEEVSALPEVRTVTVDLSTGALGVVSSAGVDPTRLRVAVEEAGYQLVVPVGTR